MSAKKKKAKRASGRKTTKSAKKEFISITLEKEALDRTIVLAALYASALMAVEGVLDDARNGNILQAELLERLDEELDKIWSLIPDKFRPQNSEGRFR